jgi:hypothetical protein
VWQKQGIGNFNKWRLFFRNHVPPGTIETNREFAATELDGMEKL